jgi:hypothetical protein
MDRENDELHVTLRRIDGAWHVVAADGDLEHTHQHAFAEHRKAWRLVEEIRDALSHGRNLNLVFWESTTLA